MAMLHKCEVCGNNATSVVWMLGRSLELKHDKLVILVLGNTHLDPIMEVYSDGHSVITCEELIMKDHNPISIKCESSCVVLLGIPREFPMIKTQKIVVRQQRTTHLTLNSAIKSQVVLMNSKVCTIDNSSLIITNEMILRMWTKPHITGNEKCKRHMVVPFLH
jgi:hypothetical protein